MGIIVQMVSLTLGFLLFLGAPASAGPIFSFSTGAPDGKMATGSRPASGGKIEIETADDFTVPSPSSVLITGGTFTGLLTGGATVNDIAQVRGEIYRVFPKDSANPPSGNVPSRANSPSDVAFAERDSAVAGELTFSAKLLNPQFIAANSVLNGINKKPNQTTQGEGAVTGLEVEFDVTFTKPLLLAPDHYFFIPQVGLAGGEFFWLSAAKVIPAPADLQTWIRNENLAPDWLRIGTDIVGPPPAGGAAPNFNAAFSLTGRVPEPSTLALLGSGVLTLLAARRRLRRA